MKDLRRKGRFGEDAAASFLEGRGYEIVARNWRCRWGEIDIVARDGDALVFVEVKSGFVGRFGAPVDWVTPAKRRRIAKAAREFLLAGGVDDAPVRFDVVTVDAATGRITHIVDAFRADEEPI